MKTLAQRLVFCWVVATTAHLPLPVCDNDAVAGAPQDSMMAGVPAAAGLLAAEQRAQAKAPAIDIDFILLGCQAPADSDDGPVDYDSEQGDGYPTFLPTRNQSGPLGELAALFCWYGDINPLEPFATSAALADCCSPGDPPQAAISFGAEIPMRC